MKAPQLKSILQQMQQENLCNPKKQKPYKMNRRQTYRKIVNEIVTVD